MRISDWSSDVCSSDLLGEGRAEGLAAVGEVAVHLVQPQQRSLGVHVVGVGKKRGRGEGVGELLLVGLHEGGPARIVPGVGDRAGRGRADHEVAGSRSEEHTSELQSLMRISYAVLCLKNKKTNQIY